jgi:hypothetical protein
MVARWSFKFADTPDEESPLRHGFFTVFPSLEAYTEGTEKFSKVGREGGKGGGREGGKEGGRGWAVKMNP